MWDVAASLSKPFTAEELLKVIHEVLHKKRVEELLVYRFSLEGRVLHGLGEFCPTSLGGGRTVPTPLENLRAAGAVLDYPSVVIPAERDTPSALPALAQAYSPPDL